MPDSVLVARRRLELALDGLTQQERLYVDARVQGAQPEVAARIAGFDDPGVTDALERDMRIRQAVEQMVRTRASEQEWTRERVAQGFEDAISMASTAVELIQAYRELGKLYGHYAAEKKEVKVTDDRIKRLSDAELARMAAIDGEFVELEDEPEDDDAR